MTRCVCNRSLTHVPRRLKEFIVISLRQILTQLFCINQRTFRKPRCAIFGFKPSARERCLSAQEVFSEVYERNLWGGTNGELYSGPGSRYAPAEVYVTTIAEFIKANGIFTVVDLGCGDFAIGKQIAAVCETYVGVDVVPDLIRKNTQLYGSDRVKFVCLDITVDELPKAQLCLVRQVLQHLSNEQILRIIEKLKRAKYPHLIITEHYPSNPICYNRDKVHGPGTRVEDCSGVFLDKPPFSTSNLELLIETVPMVPAENGGAQTRHDWGVIRTFKVTL
jgi:hypothetical protein